MLQRDTLYSGTQNVYSEVEISYPTSHGMVSTVPYHSQWKTVLVEISGGLDSAILLFLIAKTFADLKAKVSILPFSVQPASKVATLPAARETVRKVKSLIDYPYFLPSLELHIPPEESYPPKKDLFFDTAIRKLLSTGEVCFEMNGSTKNPPSSVRQFFPNDAHRPLTRDHRTSIYNGFNSASPHALNDKFGIVDLYRQFGVLEYLASHTVSCDMNLEEIKLLKLPVPCESCWWCHERRWGFDSHNLKDPAKDKKSC